MSVKMCIVLCVFVLVIHNIHGFGTKSDKENIANDLLNVFQKAIDQMRQCLDQLMAKTVDEINPKKLEPIFDAVGDHVNRITKAVNDLTAPNSKSHQY